MGGSMRIDDAMIYRAACVLHTHYGINAKPSLRDLDLATHILLAAIEEAHPKSQAEVEDALEYNRRNNP
jgi:hypothetical protein